MVYDDILNNLFYRKGTEWLIPYANFLVTFLRKKKIVTTKFNKELKAYIHIQSGKVLVIDKFPWWAITYERLYQNVMNICCQYYMPKIGDIVFDIGAGVGSETLIFSDFVGDTGRVYSIEANPKTFEYLKKMSFLNNLKNVYLINVAISDKKGYTYIENKKHHVSNRITDSKKNSILINTISIDELVEENHLKKIDFLKVNIEGAEIEMIKGMNKSIHKIRNFAISCHDFLFGNKTDIKESLIHFFSNHGFEIHTVSTGHPVRDSWIFGRKI